jgi:hypothetical protein
MSKAKIIAKIQRDGGTYSEGNNHYGEYVFEAWLPDEFIWDNDHQTGMVYYERGQFGSMSDFWKEVAREIDRPIKRIK